MSADNDKQCPATPETEIDDNVGDSVLCPTIGSGSKGVPKKFSVSWLRPDGPATIAEDKRLEDAFLRPPREQGPKAKGEK